MKLDFSIPEFIRIIWASEEARDKWESRIASAVRAWDELERMAVHAGIKPAALQICAPDKLPLLMQWALDRNLFVSPLNQQGIKQGYMNTTAAYEPDKPWAYRVVIGRPGLVRQFSVFWKGQQNIAIGEALGFPPCCQDFFEEYWVKEGWRDLTYPMVMKSDPDERNFQVDGPIYTNILLRWIGIRFVSHLPCSFNCPHSADIGQQMKILGSVNGFKKEMDWIEEMLSWPVRWSSLHGVALITTPIFRIVTDSTAIAERVTIDREGTMYPKEGARGNEFPFRADHPLHLIRKVDSWTDNGFSSLDSMTHAHQVIIDLINNCIRDEKTGRVIDLGCGNGLLLEKIYHYNPGIDLVGIESDEKKYSRAVFRLSEYSAKIIHGDLHNDIYWDPPYFITIVSANRLLEIDYVELQDFLHRLIKGSKYLVIYSYDENDPTLRLVGEKIKPIAGMTDQNYVAHLFKTEASDSSGSTTSDQSGDSGNDISGNADENCRPDGQNG